MEWIENLNQSIIFIEEHITEEIDYQEVAKIAGCSSYHFQRMFSYLANVTLSEYIRRRKMSLAAAELQSGSDKVIDIAVKYGYASPTAFNRAFSNIHGIAPSLAKKSGAVLKSYPPISFKITVKGEKEMNFRIEEKPAFRIVGVSAPLSKDLEKNFEVVPQMWGKVAMDGTLQKLSTMMDSEPMGVLGLSVGNDNEDWKYFIAVASTQEACESFEEYTVAPFTWAVFPGEGPSSAIQDLERRVIGEWLPTSGYEYDNGPDVEVYLTPDPENAKFEVWIPVKKK